MSLIKKYEPFLLLLLILPVLILRVTIESTNYTTPDSVYYLEVSRNILSGEGCVGPKVFELDTANHLLIPLYYTTSFGHPEHYKKEFFAVWPLGYPLGIVGISLLTGLEPLWASKIFNIFLLALDFYILYLLFGKNSYLPLYYFGSYVMLEICSYTWSENLFLPFFLLFAFSIKRIHESEKFSIRNVLLFSFTLIGMTLARYASAIFFVGGGILLLWYISKKETLKVKSILIGLTLGTIGLGLYLFNNYIQSGYITGMPRVNTQEFSSEVLIGKLFLGIFNQLHIIKQFRISNNADLLFYCTSAMLQLILVVYIGFLFVSHSIKKHFIPINNHMIFLGFLYLVFLIYMTFTSTIDPFDYRTLLPFSFPVFIALLNEIEQRLKINNHHKAVWAIKIFFLISLFMNLPKQYIIGLIS